jgi:hypothetical protein
MTCSSQLVKGEKWRQLLAEKGVRLSAIVSSESPNRYSRYAILIHEDMPPLLVQSCCQFR